MISEPDAAGKISEASLQLNSVTAVAHTMASNPCIVPVWLPMILAMILLINLQYTVAPSQGPSVECHSNNELSTINSIRNTAFIDYISMLSKRAIVPEDTLWNWVSGYGDFSPKIYGFQLSF